MKLVEKKKSIKHVQELLIKNWPLGLQLEDVMRSIVSVDINMTNYGVNNIHFEIVLQTGACGGSRKAHVPDTFWDSDVVISTLQAKRAAKQMFIAVAC